MNNYDNVVNVYKDYNEFQSRLGVEIQKTVGQNQNVNILEIGTGTGITTEVLLSSLPNIQLVSIDIDEQAITEISQRLSKKTNVQVICSDILEYIKNTELRFDIVISAFTIHNFTREYREEFFDTLPSIMTKDSLFINADKYTPDDDSIANKALQNLVGRYFDVFTKEGALESLKYWVLHYIDDFSPGKVMRLSESIDLLRSKGFEQCEYIFKEEETMRAILKARWKK